MKTTTEQFKNHTQAVLRAFKDANGYTAEDIAGRSGIGFSTVNGHLFGQTLPNVGHIAGYIACFGPAFLNALYGPVGVTGAHYVQPLSGCLFSNTMRLTDQGMGVFNKIIHFASDGRFDHTETPIMPSMYRDLAAGLNLHALSIERGAMQ